MFGFGYVGSSVMTNDRFLFVLRLVGTVLRLSRDQTGGALSSAAVPRVGLGPTTPPLCRCAKRATDLILRAPFVIPSKAGIQSCGIPTLFAALALGVSGVAKSRGRPQAGGHSRSHLPQVPRRTKPIRCKISKPSNNNAQSQPPRCPPSQERWLTKPP